jgi:antibiotic biosynthesis monooxygenase (ABM) superfamily enzyme
MDGEDLQNKVIAPRWQARIASTLAAWLVAFLVVTALLRLFGDQLGSLPLELRALVLSGVLVGLMANVVMPALTVVVARWMRNSSRARVGEVRLRTDHQNRTEKTNEALPGALQGTAHTP